MRVKSLEQSIIMQTKDIQEAAKLHKRCLPASLIGDLPEWMIEKFYKSISESVELDLVLHRIDGVVIGVAVLSKVGFGGSKKALPKLAYFSVLIKNPRDVLMSFFRGSSSVSSSNNINIEFLFVDSSDRSKGVGGQLVGSLKSRYSQIYVSTRSNSDNRALSFYQKNGFKKVAERVVAGREFTEFYWSR
jgi:ribosomal protein S18 acetylase RimI-like enzyme